MRSSTLFLLMIFILSCVVVDLHAQTKQTLKTTISGQVTIKGKPAPGVVVGLRRAEEGEILNTFEVLPKATTDQDGNYRISNVPAGTYVIQPAAPAYIVSGQLDFGGKSVVVGEGETIENINFVLIRGGVITGKVTDADGRPVIQVAVNIYSASTFERTPQNRPQSQIRSSTGAQTDDRGIYRAFGLMPGRYMVAVGRGSDMTTGNMAFGGRSGFKQVFYPEGNDPAKAEIIEVTEGGEVRNINLVVGGEIKTFSARGQVVDAESGTPLPNVNFILRRLTESSTQFVSGVSTISNNNGEFVIEGLTPGRYGPFLLNDANSQHRLESGTFEIINENISGVVIKLSQGSSISGLLTIEGDDKSSMAKLTQLRVQVSVEPLTPQPAGSYYSSQNGGGEVSTDGSFRLGGLSAGLARFMVTGKFSPLAKGFMISRIERDGVVQPSGIELKDGEQVSGVRIVVNYGNSTIKGVVTFTNGSPPPSGRLWVRISRPGDRMEDARGTRIDDRGHFVFEGLPAGLYEIFASVFVPNGQSPSVKQQVSVPGNGVTEVVLTIDLSAPPNRQPN